MLMNPSTVRKDDPNFDFVTGTEEFRNVVAAYNSFMCLAGHPETANDFIKGLGVKAPEDGENAFDKLVKAINAYRKTV